MKGASIGDNEMVAQHLQNAGKLGAIGGGTAGLGGLMARGTENIGGESLSPQDIYKEILNLNRNDQR
ncbi:MAG: hypothetical protein H0X38_08595 [Planctomycetes bacterium]|nr:hypothetical protein [Planctomycetota bacterium]